MRCQQGVDDASVAVLAGRRAVCEDCVTTEELAQAAAALGRLASALEASGLGDDTDVENMPDDEYDMRESLAAVLYRHEEPSGRQQQT